MLSVHNIDLSALQAVVSLTNEINNRGRSTEPSKITLIQGVDEDRESKWPIIYLLGLTYKKRLHSFSG